MTVRASETQYLHDDHRRGGMTSRVSVISRGPWTGPSLPKFRMNVPRCRRTGLTGVGLRPGFPFGRTAVGRTTAAVAPTGTTVRTGGPSAVAALGRRLGLGAAVDASAAGAAVGVGLALRLRRATTGVPK